MSNITIFPGDLLVIAGPCAVESRRQLLSIAGQIKRAGIKYLRGGAYKPRTDPHSFQGLGEEGLAYLAEAKKIFNLKIVTEILSSEQLNVVNQVADILQIGTRNMFNYGLLRDLGRKASQKPVLLKRNFAATKKELFGSIEYIRSAGHQAEIVICERGIRTFANGEYDRFTLDIGLIANLKQEKNPYRIVVDPSHAAGDEAIVESLALAGIAAGADGLLIEIKEPGAEPIVDGRQAIDYDRLEAILRKAKKIKDIF